MGRLTFLFTLALIALQGSYGASIGSPRNEMDDLLGEYLDTMNEANKLIFFIGDHLSSIARDYEHKISETVMQESTFPVLEDLRDTISKIESEIVDDSKHCVDTAYRMVMLATEELKRGVDNCVSEARTVGGEAQSVLQNLDGKATDLRVRVVTGMHNCMLIGEDVTEENVKCLQDLIVPLKQELVELQKEVNDVHDNVHKLTEVGIENLNSCLHQVKEDVSLKSETILDRLTQCTQKRLTKPISRGIVDFFRELKQKIEKIIKIVSNLPTSIDQIPDKIQEIISKLNIAAISNQLQDEINLIIEDGGRDAEKCRASAEKRLHEIVDFAENAAKVCMDDADGEIEDITNQVTALVDEAKKVLSDFNKQILQCTLENILNPIGFAKCLESHYDEYKQRVTDLQKKVTDSVQVLKTRADEILKQVATCVNKVQVDAVKQGQTLITDVEKCVLTIHYIY